MTEKTFTDVVEARTSSFFPEVDQSPELAGYFVGGLGTSIAAYLKEQLFDSDKTMATLEIPGLMKFTLVANKKGDSVALVPGFDMLDDGKKYIAEDDLKFSKADITDMAKTIRSNEKYLCCAKEAIACKIYDDGEWKETESNTIHKGVMFEDETDVSVVVVSLFASIIEILANTKDSVNDIEYPIDNFGKFTVKPVKDGYNVTLTFDKEFKTLCKSDKLAEKFAKMDI